MPCSFVNWLTDSSEPQLLGSRQLEGKMDITQYYRAMEAFSRQHAKMDGESEGFWLAQAEVLGKLATNAHRQKVVMHPTMRISAGE